MAARSEGTIQEMVYWYNMTPNENGKIPIKLIFTNNTRLMNKDNPDSQKTENNEMTLQIYGGDTVL